MGCKQSKDKKEEASASAGEAAAEAAVAEGETAGDEVEGAAPKLVVVFRGHGGARGLRHPGPLRRTRITRCEP